MVIAYIFLVGLQEARTCFISYMDSTTLIRFGRMISYLVVLISDTGK